MTTVCCPMTNTTHSKETPTMTSTTCTRQPKAMTITGWVLTLLPALFLLMDATMKLLKPDFVIKATTQLGYSESVIFPLGLVLTAATLLYLFPRTSILGAILLTGYLGGAVDCHVHAAGSSFEILFPALFGVLLWLGLFLRTPKLRTLFPFKK